MRLRRQFGPQSGFALVELMIIIVIIGILASIAIVSYQSRIRQTHLATIYHEINEFRSPYQILVYEGAGVTNFSPAGLNLNEHTKYCQFSVTAPVINDITLNAIRCQIINIPYLHNQYLSLNRDSNDNWQCVASAGINKAYLPNVCR